MYGHPALVVDHARALASSSRAFNRWFWKESCQVGLFPESVHFPPSDNTGGKPLLLPSPAPLVPLMEQAGGLYSTVAVSSTTATKSHG